MDRNSDAVGWARQTLNSALDLVELAWGSAAEGQTLRLSAGSLVVYLKQGESLSGERERLDWLQGRLPVPELLGFQQGEEDWLLTRALPGLDLSQPTHKAEPEWLVGALASALQEMHALEPFSCPFRHSSYSAATTDVVVHGDACLPNFVFSERRLSGYLDVGGLRLDQVEVDLAAAVWSLDYNLGPGWGGLFLKAYGWPSDAEVVAELRQYYEDGFV